MARRAPPVAHLVLVRRTLAISQFQQHIRMTRLIQRTPTREVFAAKLTSRVARELLPAICALKKVTEQPDSFRASFCQRAKIWIVADFVGISPLRRTRHDDRIVRQSEAFLAP